MSLFTDKDVEVLDELFDEVSVYRHSKDSKKTREWFARYSSAWGKDHANRIIQRLKRENSLKYSNVLAQ